MASWCGRVQALDVSRCAGPARGQRAGGSAGCLAAAVGYLLQHPGDAVRVTEADEQAPRLGVDPAGRHAALDELAPGRRHVRDHHLNALLRAWGHLGDPDPEDDGTGRAGRGELYEA